jgi:hypothetical protein
MKLGKVLITALVVVISSNVFGQTLTNDAVLQNPSGNRITIGTPASVTDNKILLPGTLGTTGALLYISGVAGTTGTTSWLNPGTNGQVLTLTAGVPTWTSSPSLDFWSLTGNSITSAYNGTSGNFIGTTNTQPFIIATTNTTTPQAIQFWTNNTERMRLLSTGELGIGTTPTTSRLLHVAGTAGTANVRMGSLANGSSQTRLVNANASGDLNTIVNGSDGQVMTLSGGIPTWADASTAGQWWENLASATTSLRWTVSGHSNTIGNGTAYSLVAGQSNSIAALRDRSTIAGGQSNTINSNATHAFIGSGTTNTVSDLYSSIVGGHTNTLNTNADRSFIGGGASNSSSSSYSAIVGGQSNVISGSSLNTFIGGGNSNTLSANYSAIVGGQSNNVSAAYSFIGGGNSNTISSSAANYSSILGGQSNTVHTNSNNAAILGGRDNVITNSSDYSVILGGRGLTFTSARGSIGFIGDNITNSSPMSISTNYTAVIGNMNLWMANTNNTAGQIRFYEAQNTTGSFPSGSTQYSSFEAGSQTADIRYVLPTTAPTVTNQVLAATTTSNPIQLAWQSPSYWGLTGNSGTTAGTNFIGTTDAVDFVVKTGGSAASNERIRVTSGGKVGIGNITANTTLDVSGDFATRMTTYTASAGANNNVNFGNTSAVYVTASGNFDITGIAGGQNGKMLVIHNASGKEMTIVNQSNLSSSGNRIRTGAGLNMAIGDSGSITLMYQGVGDITSSWIVSSFNEGALALGNLNSSRDNFEDFIFDAYAGSGSNDNQYSFTKVSTINGAVQDVDGIISGGVNITTNDFMGLHQQQTGTTSNSNAQAILSGFDQVNKLRLGGKQVVYEVRLRVENTTAPSFIHWNGLVDGDQSGSNTDPNNGVFVKYTQGGTWDCITRSGGTSTTISSSANVVANQWYKIRSVINAAGTQCDWYIDDIYIGSSVSNIPSAALRPLMKTRKNATSNISRSVSMDWVIIRMVR